MILAVPVGIVVQKMFEAGLFDTTIDSVRILLYGFNHFRSWKKRIFPQRSLRQRICLRRICRRRRGPGRKRLSRRKKRQERTEERKEKRNEPDRGLQSERI